MRYSVLALVLFGAASLTGCGSNPPDPYANIRMLSPDEMVAVQEQQDSVQQAEKAHHAKFARARTAR